MNGEKTRENENNEQEEIQPEQPLEELSSKPVEVSASGEAKEKTEDRLSPEERDKRKLEEKDS